VQVIYLVTHWLHTYTFLQKPDLQDTVVAVSQQLTQVAKEFFSRHMGGGLVYELIVTRLCQVSSLSLAGCLMLGRGRKLPSLALYQLDVLLPRL
jgi:hypothetical protein